jgi:hypothetical protein
MSSSLYPFCMDLAENIASLLLGRRSYSTVAEKLRLLDCCLRIRFCVNVSRFLAVIVYSGFSIPAFWHRVTIYTLSYNVTCFSLSATIRYCACTCNLSILFPALANIYIDKIHHMYTLDNVRKREDNLKAHVQYLMNGQKCQNMLKLSTSKRGIYA